MGRGFSGGNQRGPDSVTQAMSEKNANAPAISHASACEQASSHHRLTAASHPARIHNLRPHCLDVPGFGRIGLDDPAQPRHLHVDAAVK